MRLVYLAALAVWLGGLLVLGGIAAPTIFAVAEAHDPASGRVLAGTMFGVVLARFHVVAALCGLLMMAALVAMALIGPRPRPYAARLVVIGLMLLTTAVVAFPVGRGIARLHPLSNVLLLANAAGGLLLLAWEARH